MLGRSFSSAQNRPGEFDAAYTPAKAFNYANEDQIPFEYSPIGPTNLQREYGRPPNDQRHRLVLSGLGNLPWKFHFAPIWTIASGVPMDILLPDGSERVPALTVTPEGASSIMRSNSMRSLRVRTPPAESSRADSATQAELRHLASPLIRPRGG
jgi:hypothetical protein